MKTASTVLATLVVAISAATTAQTCQAQEGANRVPGIWVTQFQTPWGSAAEKLVLQHNGTFTKTFYCNGKMAYFAGHYRVGPGFVRFYHRDGNYRGRTETWRIELRGPNQMQCFDAVIMREWIYHRA